MGLAVIKQLESHLQHVCSGHFYLTSDLRAFLLSRNFICIPRLFNRYMVLETRTSLSKRVTNDYIKRTYSIAQRPCGFYRLNAPLNLSNSTKNRSLQALWTLEKIFIQPLQQPATHLNLRFVAKNHYMAELPEVISQNSLEMFPLCDMSFTCTLWIVWLLLRHLPTSAFRKWLDSCALQSCSSARSFRVPNEVLDHLWFQ